jgi:hypothetical protein
MVTLDCPWCDAPVSMDGEDAIRCDRCAVVVALAPDAALDVAPEVALAA